MSETTFSGGLASGSSNVSGSYGSTTLDSRTAPSGYFAGYQTNEPDVQASTRARDRKPASRKVTSTERHQVAEQLADAIRHARGLEAASSSSDPEAAAIAGIDLRENLRRLWQLRHVRSDDWATVVNKLQVVTSSVDFENFTSEMSMAIRLVIESHLRPDADNDDVRAATTLLERVHLNPWKTLGGD